MRGLHVKMGFKISKLQLFFMFLPSFVSCVTHKKESQDLKTERDLEIV